MQKSKKPTQEQMIAVLQNLQSCMLTAEVMLDQYGRKDKADELEGASEIVHGWLEAIKEENHGK